MPKLYLKEHKIYIEDVYEYNGASIEKIEDYYHLRCY